MNRLPKRASSADRILDAFRRLVSERGLDATTTRLLAEEAGVSEVTIFRHFGDKAGLVRTAIERAAPAATLAGYQLAIDTSSPDRAAAGLVDCLRFVRDRIRDRPDLVQFGTGDFWRFPELRAEFARAPQAARALIERAVDQAAPVLRPEVDRRVAAFMLQSLVFVSVVWQSRGWLDASESEWDEMLRAAVRVLL